MISCCAEWDTLIHIISYWFINTIMNCSKKLKYILDLQLNSDP